MHLSALHTTEHGFGLLNLSQAVELADALGVDLDAPFARSAVEQIIGEFSHRLSTAFSGIILGPEIGFAALDQKNDKTGVLFSLLSQTETQLVSDLPTIFPNWSVQHIRNNFGLVYLKLYYNPRSATATQKWQLASELYDASRYEGCGMVIELPLYPEENQAVTRELFTELQLQSALQMQKVCDALILEYPHSAISAATLTAKLDVPWLLVDRTEDYGFFKEQLRTCLESGASGVSLGPVLWANIPTLSFEKGQPQPDQWQAIQNYLQTEMRDRSIEIMRIVEEGLIKRLEDESLSLVSNR